MGLSKLFNKHRPAILALADGSVFHGSSIGVDGSTVGEVVFNTSMSGYQEMLTDPSYAKQIITLTYPHIGNVGVNEQDTESQRVWAAGLIIRDLSLVVSNYRATLALEEYLLQQRVVAIADIDTRALTRKLREGGAQNGCIMTGDDANAAIAQAKRFCGLHGLDLASKVTVSSETAWESGRTDMEKTVAVTRAKERLHIVVVDFGCKSQIMRILVDAGCEVTRLPANSSAQAILACQPDGVLLSNGPGDPGACHDAIRTIQALMQQGLPIMGICLGFQLLALSSGAATVKMKFGHHGANHPIQDVQSKTVFITSQNHGFAVDEGSLPDEWKVTHRSLFDGSLQGIAHCAKPFYGIQGHPEASPGPHDAIVLFEPFINECQHAKEKRS